MTTAASRRKIVRMQGGGRIILVAGQGPYLSIEVSASEHFRFIENKDVSKLRDLCQEILDRRAIEEENELTKRLSRSKKEFYSACREERRKK